MSAIKSPPVIDSETLARHSKPMDRGLRAKLRHPHVFVLLLVLALSFEYWCLGPYSYIRIHDNGDSFFTRTAAAAQDFKHNGVSYWLPFMTGGVDRLSQDLSYLHPDFLLNLLFPNWLAYQLLILLQFGFAALGTYLICRDSLGLRREAAQLGAFGFAAFVSGLQYMQLGPYLFPLTLWYLNRIRTSTRSPAQALLKAGAAGLIYGVCSSFPITIPFASVLAILWFWFVVQARAIRFWFTYLVFQIALLIPHAMLIWALLLNSPLSHRASRQFANLSEVYATLGNAPSGLLIFGIGLFLLAPFFVRFRVRCINRITGLFAFCWFGVLAINITKYGLGHYLSFFNGFQFDRFYEFAPFFGAVGAAYVLHFLKSDDWARQKSASNSRYTIWVARGFSGFICAALIVLAALNKYEHLRAVASDGSDAYIYQSPELEALRTRSITTLDGLYRVATLGGVIHPAFANGYNIETIDGYPNLYPNRFKLFWASVIEPETATNPRIRRYFSDWGNRAYLFEPAGNVQSGESIYNLDLLSLANTKYLISRKPILDSRLELVRPGRATVAHGVRNLVTKLTTGREDLYLYRNPEVQPRAFFVPGIFYFEDEIQLNSALERAPLKALKSAVFLERRFRPDIPQLSAHPNSDARVSLARYTPDRIDLEVSGSESGIVVLTDVFTPYWRALVDGAPAKTIPAYGSFLGVPVTAGSHSLIFNYQPPYANVLPEFLTKRGTRSGVPAAGFLF